MSKDIRNKNGRKAERETDAIRAEVETLTCDYGTIVKLKEDFLFAPAGVYRVRRSSFPGLIALKCGGNEQHVMKSVLRRCEPIAENSDVLLAEAAETIEQRSLERMSLFDGDPFGLDLQADFEEEGSGFLHWEHRTVPESLLPKELFPEEPGRERS